MDKKEMIECCLNLLETHCIPHAVHRKGVHINIDSNFGIVQIWPTTQKIQVQGQNYDYENLPILISMIESLRARPTWMVPEYRGKASEPPRSRNKERNKNRGAHSNSTNVNVTININF